MNKKVGIVISVIVAAAVIFFLTVIILNQNSSKKDEKIENNVEQGKNDSEQNAKENVENSQTENVVLSSKIGNTIQDLIYIPNIYSDSFFKEVEASGLDDRAKIMFTFAKIVTDDEYLSLRRKSEEYVGDYVTKDDLESVAKKLFTNTSNLKHQEVFLSGSYDSKEGNYIILPTGFVEFNYIKDIPYKIEETGDNITVYTYRLYVNCNTVETMEENTNSTHTIYYDDTKKNKTLVINDEKMDDENTQNEFLNSKISSGEISKDKMKQGVYKIQRKGNSYLIEDIK